MRVEAEIRDHLLETLIFFLKLPELAKLRCPQSSVLLLSPVVALLGDAHLPDYFLDRCSQLSLLKGKGDLLLVEFRCLHGKILLGYFARKLTLRMDQFCGRGPYMDQAFQRRDKCVLSEKREKGPSGVDHRGAV